MLASAGISRRHVSVCLSVTRRYCVKTAKRGIMQHANNTTVDTSVKEVMQLFFSECLSVHVCQTITQTVVGGLLFNVGNG